MPPERLFRPHPNIVFTRLDATQSALLHLDTKRYYSVNETGAMIWEMLEGESSPEAIAAEISKEYDLGEDEALPYVLEFLGELDEEGLVR
ncbi:MAG: PqqD family protein [bacterium]|nr:PqqD family protein [bacterium]